MLTLTTYYLLAASFGLLLGNYATSLLFRLPRGIDLSGLTQDHKPPFCSSCRHLLKYREALPVLSWMFTRFRCNYCGIKVTPHYFYLEFFTALASLFLFHLFGFSDYYIVLLPFLTLCLFAGLLVLQGHEVPGNIFYSLIIFALFYRLLLEGSLFPSLFPLANFILLYLLIIKKFPTLHRKEGCYFSLQAFVLLGSQAIVLLPLTFVKTKYRLIILFMIEISLFFYSR